MARYIANRETMRRPLSLTLLFALACGGTEEPSTTPTDSPATEAQSNTAGEGETPAEEADPPAYDVHEWGLIDLAPGLVEVAAGSGSTPQRGRIGPGPMRKPVLYVHLADHRPVTFSASVGANSEFAEHWPGTLIDGRVLTWPRITAAPGNCTGLTYPTQQSPECQDPPDGYCELADLRFYESRDSACLTMGEETYNHLFYRTRGQHYEAPIDVRRVDGHIEITNAGIDDAARSSLHATASSVFYIRRHEVGSRERVVAARLPMPGQGETARFEEANAQVAAQAERELREALAYGGLTHGESQAFERAWFAELFQNGRTGGAPLVRESILYVLPESIVERFSNLNFDPEPRFVKRVFLVRMSIEGSE